MEPFVSGHCRPVEGGLVKAPAGQAISTGQNGYRELGLAGPWGGKGTGKLGMKSSKASQGEKFMVEKL